MSDNKKRDRALQHRVRARQVKTGESYQAAWRFLTGIEALKPPNNFEAPRRLRRVPLSLGTGFDKILPGQSAKITARPQLDSFWPERLLIKDVDRWDIHRLTAGRQKFALIRDVTTPAFSLDTWHPLTSREVFCGEEIVAVVTYTGTREQGECFEAALFGWEGGSPNKVMEHGDTSDSVRISERAESRPVGPNEPVSVRLAISAPALFVDRLTIADARDWIVNNIRTCERSIFVQAGDLPGEMFSGTCPVILEPLVAENCVQVFATYIGNSPSTRLNVELSGTANPPSTPRRHSQFLPMSSTGTSALILPSQCAQITTRPQSAVFYPERLVIARPDDWTVEEITIGTHHQFAARGGLPGQSFASHAVGSHMVLEPVRGGQDVILLTTRSEDCKEAAPFFCGVQGCCA